MCCCLSTLNWSVGILPFSLQNFVKYALATSTLSSSLFFRTVMFDAVTCFILLFNVQVICTTDITYYGFISLDMENFPPVHIL